MMNSEAVEGREFLMPAVVIRSSDRMLHYFIIVLQSKAQGTNDHVYSRTDPVQLQQQ